MIRFGQWGAAESKLIANQYVSFLRSCEQAHPELPMSAAAYLSLKWQATEIVALNSFKMEDGDNTPMVSAAHQISCVIGT